MAPKCMQLHTILTYRYKPNTLSAQTLLISDDLLAYQARFNALLSLSLTCQARYLPALPELSHEQDSAASALGNSVAPAPD